ncbi:MAG: histidine kinase [Bacteroidota bacterium]
MEYVRILTIDDHEMTPLGYKYVLEGKDHDGLRVVMDVASSYDKGEEKIRISAKGVPYDIILLDIQLFPPSANDSRSGEDLGKLARKLVPDSKIVFMSSFSDNYRINAIFNSVNPDGYMVKSEIDEKSLIAMVHTVSGGKPYYSAEALGAIRRKMSNDLDVDDLDKKILYYISIGTRTKDIGSQIAASITTVETRKRQLKILFGIETGNDMALIEEAKKRGFL